MDGKYVLTRIGQILESSSKITDFVAEVDGHPAIWVARTNPVGNDYPQITMDIEFLDSHPVFATQEAILTIDTWLTQSATEGLVSQALSKLQPINNHIRDLFNLKHGQSDGNQVCISEINKEENIGLRVSRCLKSFQKDMDWDTTTNRMFATIVFNMVLSENENFQKSFGDPEFSF
jgi:hypothetical protein